MFTNPVPKRPGHYTHYKQWFLTNLFEIAHSYTLDPKATLKEISATSNEACVLKLVLPKLDIMYQKNKELIQSNSSQQKTIDILKSKAFQQNLLIRDIIQTIHNLPANTQFKTLLITKSEELVNNMEVVANA